jgi:hypothetical protein
MVGHELKDHRLHGKTFKQFCEKVFFNELCTMCDEEPENHEIGIELGNWVAICRGVN